MQLRGQAGEAEGAGSAQAGMDGGAGSFTCAAMNAVCSWRMANSASVRRRRSRAEAAAWSNLLFNLSWCDMKSVWSRGCGEAFAFLGGGARMKGLGGRERGGGRGGSVCMHKGEMAVLMIERPG